ncbi:hypothetical protein RYX36_019111 [Vicia faba]
MQPFHLASLVYLCYIVLGQLQFVISEINPIQHHTSHCVDSIFGTSSVCEIGRHPITHQVLAQHLKFLLQDLFITVALPATIDSEDVTPMTVLIQKLQIALSSMKRFSVLHLIITAS